jgi:hypothetical protein
LRAKRLLSLELKLKRMKVEVEVKVGDRDLGDIQQRA